MKRSISWTVGSFLGGLVLERILAASLASAAGGRLLARLDSRELTPFEHRVLARQWAGRISKAAIAVGAVLGAILGSRVTGRDRSDGGRQPRDWAETTSRVAELLLAVGAILKVVSEYLREREEVDAEH